MKAKLFVFVILLSCGVALNSCATSRGTGCKTSQGFVGYGHR